MKNYILFGVVLLFGVFLLVNVGAISTQINGNYSSGETVISPILGNVLGSIDPGQVSFKKGHVGVPMDYGLQKLGGNYYIWFITPFKKGTYTIVVNDILTTVRGETEKVNYEKNFTVGGNMTGYSVKPGVVLTSGPFQLQVDSYSDNDLYVNTGNFSNQGFTISPGKNVFTIGLGNLTAGFHKLVFGKYLIPVYVFENSSSPSGSNGQGNGNSNSYHDGISFKPNVISTILLENSSKVFPFSIISNYNSKIFVTFDFNSSLFLITPENATILPGGGYNFNLTLLTNKSLRGGIYADVSGRDFYFPVIVNFTKDSGEASVSYNTSQATLTYCSDMGGTTCSLSGETCSGNTVSSLDGSCCIGQCVESGGSPGGTYWWIGIILAIVLVLIGAYLFYKYKKAGADKKDYVKKRFKDAEKIS